MILRFFFFPDDGAEVDRRSPGNEFHRLGLVAHFRFDDEFVKRALAQRLQEIFFEYLFRRLAAVGFLDFRKDFYHLGFRNGGRLDGDFLHLFVFDEAERALHEIAHHALDVLADIPDLGVFGGFHLDEGRAHELCEPTRNFRLADARRPLHDDVLGRDLLSQFGRKLRPSVTVAERDRDRFLRFRLSDDMFIQFVNDLFG